MSDVHGELTVRTHDGFDIFVRTDGVHRDASPLVCLPGLTRNSRDFTTVAARWSPSRYVVRVDLRGRGRSSYDPTGATYRPDVYAADVQVVLDALGLDQATLLGTSLGGSVASLVALLAPRRVRGVILNDVGPVLDAAGVRRIQSYAGRIPPSTTWAEATDRIRALAGDTADLIAPDVWTRLVHEQFHEFGAGDIRPDHDPRVVADLAAADPDALVPTWPLFDALAAIPTLLLRGARTDLLSPATVDEMRRRKPDLTVVEVADRGHAPLLDEAESVQAIDAFLGAVDGVR